MLAWDFNATHTGEIEGIFKVNKYHNNLKVAYAWRPAIQTMADPQTD